MQADYRFAPTLSSRAWPSWFGRAALVSVPLSIGLWSLIFAVAHGVA